MATNGLLRHARPARLFHAGVYLTTLALLITGWWLLLGGEGRPSPLSQLFGMADTRLHVWIGRGLFLLALVPLVAGWKGIASFVRETVRRDRGDARWWLRWPAAVLTGRFGRHEGTFDPGQRVANVIMAGGLLVLIGTGIGMSQLHGGPVFAWLATVYRWTTYPVSVVIVGHILIALGVLPGYRGVWRAMHVGGRVPETTARRVWPGWTERELAAARVAQRERQANITEVRHG